MDSVPNTNTPERCFQLVVVRQAHATQEPGRVAEAAEERKSEKYRELPPGHVFSPIAIETLGAIGPKSLAFLKELGYSIRTDGETEPNRLKITQGQGAKSDVPLSDVGVHQVELLVERLASEEFGLEFDMVFSSDLRRTMQTASAIVARMREKKEIVADKLLREQHFGIFEDRPMSHAMAEAEVQGVQVIDFTPEGGESSQQVVLRAKQFLNKLMRQCYPLLSEIPSSSSPLASNDHQPTSLKSEAVAMSSKSSLPPHGLRVLVVSHGFWIKALLEHLLMDCPRVLFPRLSEWSPNSGVTSLLLGVAAKTSTEAAVAAEEQDIVCTWAISQCMYDASHL